MTIDRNAVTQEVPIDLETSKPYLNTVAAIQVSANGVGSEVSPYVAQAVKVIRESGLPQETNALFTNVEGDLDEVLKVAGEAAKKLAEQGYRTSLVLHMDIRPGFTGQLTERPKIVDAILSGKSECPASNNRRPACARDRHQMTATERLHGTGRRMSIA